MEEVVNQQVKTKGDALRDRLRERYPDQDFADDEAFAGRISDDYDDYDKQISGYKEREGKIVGLFNKDPKSAKFMKDWMNDGDPRVQLMRDYGKEGIMAAFDDPELADKMAEADREFVEMAANEQKLEEEYKQNLANSAKELDSMAQEKGLNDDQIDEACQHLIDMAHDVIMGKFTKEAIMSALHALNYDKDIEAANYEGEVRGKNTAIDAKLRKAKGDGMPTLAGNSARPVMQNAPHLPGALGREKEDIYAKGGFKRNPVRR